MKHLFLPPSGWVGLKQKLIDPFFARLAKNNLRAMGLCDSTRGKTLLDVPANLEEPASDRLTAVGYRVVKGRLLRAAIAWHVSEDKRAWPFASETIDFLLQPDFWRPTNSSGSIRHFDLKVADLLYCACFTLNAFEQQLDDIRRTRLLEIMIEEGLGAYSRGWEAEEWWRAAEFNWGAALHGNAGLAALAIAEVDPALSSKILARGREGLAVVIEYLPRDGCWSEGPMYHTTTLGHLSDFAIALHRTEGDDLGLSKNPRWIEALESRRYCLAPDGKLVNFSNCPLTTTEWFLPQVYWWADRLNRPEWISFEDSICKTWADTRGIFHDVESFLYRPSHPQPVLLAPLTPLRHFRGLDWVTWRGKKTWFALRAGNNGGNHNHLDLGHFILGRGQTRYLVSPGYGPQRTSQHNAVTLRGKDQADAATAPIIRCEEFAEAVHVACELQECYPHILEYHTRHLILLGDDHLFIIDRLRSQDERRLGARFHFQTDCAVKPNANGCRINAGQETMTLTSLTECPPLDIAEWHARDDALTEISFRPAADLPHELSAFRISFDEIDSPSFRVHKQQILIDWLSNSYVLNLESGQLSIGIPH